MAYQQGNPVNSPEPQPPFSTSYRLGAVLPVSLHPLSQDSAVIAIPQSARESFASRREVSQPRFRPETWWSPPVAMLQLHCL